MTTRSAEWAEREAKIAELKRLITTGHYESLEKLEDAVDSFLWDEHDRLQQNAEIAADASEDQGDEADRASDICELLRAHPK